MFGLPISVSTFWPCRPPGAGGGGLRDKGIVNDENKTTTPTSFLYCDRTGT